MYIHTMNTRSNGREITGIYNVAQGCLKRKENFVQPAMRIRLEYLFWLSYNYPIEINHPKKRMQDLYERKKIMKNMKKMIAMLMALTMMFALVACGGKEEEKKTLVLGTSADYAPFEYHKMVDGKDTILGADIKMAEKIAADLGLELQIKDISFDVLLNELQGGTIDMVIAAMNPDEERVKQATPSDPYYSEVDQIVVINADTADKFKSNADFEGAKIAVQAGTIFVEKAEEVFPGCETLILQAVPDMFNNLLNGKCDAIYCDGNVGEGYIASNGSLAAVDNVEFPVVDGMAVWVQKDDPNGFLEQVNKSIAEIAEQGLYEQWLSEAEADAE